MGLNYKILWFEDDVEIVEENKKELVELLADYGLKLEILHKDNGMDLESYIDEGFDLILTDLNLNDEDTGDKIIARIRDHSILTEVLFYSSNVKEINNIIQRHEWVERVSFAVGAGQVQNKIKQLVSLTIKKLQEVNTVRGLVMAETSDLDLKMTELLTDFFDTFSDSELKKQELINSTVNNRHDRLEKLKKTQPTDINQFCERLDAADRLNAIVRLINHTDNKLSEKHFNNNKETLSKYVEEILNIRNALAHAKEFFVDGRKGVKSTVNQVEIFFDDDSCKKIRKDISNHRSNLEEIHLKVQGLKL
ncbi:response regulator [Paenibacillus sp. Soil750]|uniref:response regulator n=1 Tax=Paenibacillus sp. Soil750 TaxID=1736398 RepID=UPI0006FCC700|nr:response regulator [Paenibacillus sp. Soil750]KRE71987.1 hypothetical protein ASL11_09430 [Paenibacillus sp. Soil750]